MATEVDTPTVLYKPLTAHAANAVPFACNLRSNDISGCEAIKAAPGTGKRIVLKQLIISSGAAITITIGEGETGTDVTTAILGPISFAANQYIYWKFAQPIALSVNTALTCDSSGIGGVNIFVEGFIT